MSSASSTETALKVTSHPVAKGVIELEQKAVSTLGRQGDTEEEIAVSRGGLESSITSEDCTRIT